jgi:hypothetical protein
MKALLLTSYMQLEVAEVTQSEPGPGAVGFRISLVNLAIWLGIGVCWWKAIGLW